MSVGSRGRTVAIAARRVKPHLMRQRRQRQRWITFFQPQRGQIQRSGLRMSISFRRLEGPSGFAPELVGPQPTVLLLHHGPLDSASLGVSALNEVPSAARN